VGLGNEILFILMLGLLVLGPKQLHASWGMWPNGTDTALGPLSDCEDGLSDCDGQAPRSLKIIDPTLLSLCWIRSRGNHLAPNSKLTAN
jgi:hypothetical protein